MTNAMYLANQYGTRCLRSGIRANKYPALASTKQAAYMHTIRYCTVHESESLQAPHQMSQLVPIDVCELPLGGDMYVSNDFCIMCSYILFHVIQGQWRVFN